MKQRIEITAEFVYDPDEGLMLTPDELADNVAMTLSDCGCDEVTADAVLTGGET